MILLKANFSQKNDILSKKHQFVNFFKVSNVYSAIFNNDINIKKYIFVYVCLKIIKKEFKNKN